LAIVNIGDGNVRILLGNGNGAFSAAVPPTYPVGGSPQFITVGDFNGDKKLDLAVANGSDNNVSILLGNGDGTFSNPAPTYNVGKFPKSLAAGDFNADHKLDLAVANEADNNVSILLGNGDGTFSNPPNPTYSVGTAPVSITTGDFNSDNKLDLAVANHSGGGVSILLGDGPGVFRPGSPPTNNGSITSPNAIASGDFDEDNNLDLIVIGDHNLSILLGDGGGTFSVASPTYGLGNDPYALTTGDFNGDKKLDLAVADDSDNNAGVLLRSGCLP